MKRILALILSVLLMITAVPSVVFSVEPETDGEPAHESQTGAPDEALVRQIGIWLNDVYGNVPGFGSAPTDGTVTYALIAALLRAFQIELGITSPANNFGPQTTARYEASPLPDPDVTEDARYAILSAALICRGYDPGEKITQTEDKILISGIYDEALERAILSLKRDAGLPTDSPLIDTELMKAVFSTMRFTPYPERGNAVFCETQRYINANFRDYTGLIPCDGLYDRDLVFAMIRTVQAALGLPKDEITYRFGPLTRSLFPTLPYDAAAENAGRRYPGDKTGDLFSDKDVEALTVVLQTALIGKAWNSVYLSNHDQPRQVSRYGNDGPLYRVRSAKMLATLIHLMHGTPYIYNGEELGMTNIYFTDLEQYRDVEVFNAWKQWVGSGLVHPEDMMRYFAKISRDNARTPMQWDTTKHAGFTTGTPWIEVNRNYLEINAADEVRDPDSVYHYYRKLIALRHEQKVVVYGSFVPLLEDDPMVYAYRRELDGKQMTVLCNWTQKTAPCTLKDETAGEIVLSNYALHQPGVLQPYEAIVFLN